MARFRRKIDTAAYASSPTIEAGAAGSSQIGQFITYTVGAVEEAALSIPTIARAVSLLSTVVGTLDLKSYVLQWNGEEYEKIWVEGESWMSRPDPRVTRNFFFSKLAKDCIMYGRGFAAVTSRYSTGYPASFQWLPANMVVTEDQTGPEWFGPSNEIYFLGQKLVTSDVVQFHTGNQGLVYQGARAVKIALRLDESAARFASNEIAAGYLQQKGGEPMSSEELGELAAAWASARRSPGGAVGALNEFVEWREFSSDPSKLQLVESRQHQALELARLCDIPGYLLGIDQSGMTYMNAQQARQDLILFGARPLLHAIEERLSMDDILPRGRHVQFGVEEYVEDFLMDSERPSVVNEPSPELPSDEMNLE